MTLDADRQNEMNQVWMDSLLHEALNPEPHREHERLKTLFDKPVFDDVESNSTVNRRFGPLVRWLPIAIAASISIALGSWSLFSTSSQRAYAVLVARSSQR